MKKCIVVIAKRYLVSKNDNYYNQLSDASKKTLEYQGGKMSIEEITDFENNQDFHEILRIRYYDDNGKKIGIEIPDLSYYYSLINKYLNCEIKYRNDLETNGYLLIKDFFSKNETETIINFKKELEELEECKGKWMTYFEEKDGLKKKITY